MANSDFFRPVFTERILSRLKAGAVLNLVGTDYEGATRLLQDIQAANPDGIVTLLVDMEVYKEDYKGFFKAISESLGLPEPVQDMGEWIEALKMHGGQLFLFLNHFDCILDNEHYPPEFFTQLNDFFLAPRLSLICVSTHPLEMDIKDMDSFSDQGQFQPEIYKLPPIGYKRLREELVRLQPNLEDWNSIASPIFAHKDTYGLLEFVGKHLADMREEDLPGAKKQVELWIREYDGELQPLSPDEEKSFWGKLWQRLFS